MRAIAVTPRRAGSLRLLEVGAPDPGDADVLLEVQEVGICGTDRDIVAGFYGEPPPGSSHLVLGHESICRVSALGKRVSGLKRGELVVPTVRRGCPQMCLSCRSGESDMCLTGDYREHGIKGLHGFASDRAVSDHRFLVKLPESLEKVGVLLEPLSIVEKALAQVERIQAARMKRWRPEKALVLGSGPVGLLATAILRLRGLEVHTVATRPAQSIKARLAESTGARYINSRERPLGALEHRYDIVLEVTGNVGVALEAQSLTRLNGIVSYLGIYREQVASEDAGMIFTNLVLGNRVHFGSVNANRSYFESGVSDMARIQKVWPGLLGRMITRRARPEEFADAYSSADEEEIKTVVDFRM